MGIWFKPIIKGKTVANNQDFEVADHRNHLSADAFHAHTEGRLSFRYCLYAIAFGWVNISQPIRKRPQQGFVERVYKYRSFFIHYLTHTLPFMENQVQVQQESVNQLYAYAAHLMVNEDKNSVEVVDLLGEKGLDHDSAWAVVRNLEDEIDAAKKKGAQKDILWGAVWCVGGTVATLADTGFIFWGAIVFGGIQFIKGLVNYSK